MPKKPKDRAIEIETGAPPEASGPEEAPVEIQPADAGPGAAPAPLGFLRNGAEDHTHTSATKADLTVALPRNVPVDGNYETYREFLLRFNPLATTVNRAKIQLAWIYGEALNAFLASPHYQRGDYKKLLTEIGMSWTKAHYVRMLAEQFTLENALKYPSYSDLLREMKQLPDREPRQGDSRGVGDHRLDAVDPPDPIDHKNSSEEKQDKGKKPSKAGRPALNVTHENVLLRLEEVKAQLIKIKTMNPPNMELADATALYDRIRSETVEIQRLVKDIHVIADAWVNKNGAFVPSVDPEAC